MSHIRTTLAAALLTFGGVVVASAQQPATAPHARAGHFGRHAGAARTPFLRGITLSDAEKANVKAVNEKYGAQMKALRGQNKPDMQAMRDARQKGDSAALKAMWEKSKGQREQMQQLMQAQRNDLRAALSADNQSKFDANVAAFQKRSADRMAGRAGKGRAPKFGKPGI
jgi:Spy/CpxP family protein refolding chaperone